MLEEGIYSKEKYISRTQSLEKDLSALRTSLQELESRSYSDLERKKNAIPTIIDRIEYMKVERNTRYNPDEVKFTLKIHVVSLFAPIFAPYAPIFAPN